jgi:hypothetical protein
MKINLNDINNSKIICKILNNNKAFTQEEFNNLDEYETNFIKNYIEFEQKNNSKTLNNESIQLIEKLFIDIEVYIKNMNKNIKNKQLKLAESLNIEDDNDDMQELEKKLNSI